MKTIRVRPKVAVIFGVAVFGLITTAYWALPTTEVQDDPPPNKAPIKIIQINSDQDRATRNGSKTAKGKADNSEKCTIPKLEMYPSELQRFFKDAAPLECAKKFGENWGNIVNGKFVLKSAYASSTCDMRYIRRKDDNAQEYSDWQNIKCPFQPEEDFFETRCSLGRKSWKGIFMTVVKKNVTKPAIEGTPPLNVYVFSLDSLSQMTFRRKLVKTTEYLEKTMGSVILNGYNIVGDGTPQAFIPILTGQTEEELPLTRNRFKDAKYVDVYPWIWNDYKKKGFATMYLEDCNDIGTFTYRLKGFEKRPTDHYTREFFGRVEEVVKGNRLCLYGEEQHKQWIRYGTEFVNAYADQPYFGVMHHARLSHEDINSVQVADDDLHNHMKSLHSAGKFENTVVIFMADHGHRFDKLRSTHQGQLEERLPFFSVYFPEKLRDDPKYAAAYKNLLENKDRLTTPFDVHATFLDILNWPSEEDLQKEQNTKSRKMSLLRPIPKERNCQQADIPPHFCTCLNWEKTDVKDATVFEVTKATVNAINNQFYNDRDKCATLFLDEIQDARVLKPDDSLLNYVGVKDLDGFQAKIGKGRHVTNAKYQLKFRTMPGEAIYEATVEFDAFARELQVDFSAISHVNKYGDRPHCIVDSNPMLLLWCVCHDKVTVEEKEHVKKLLAHI